jgi:cell division protein FtsB
MDLLPDPFPLLRSSRTYFKIILVLLLIIQGMGALIVKNVYDRFVQLEQENRVYDDELDELRAQIEILQFRLQNNGRK